MTNQIFLRTNIDNVMTIRFKTYILSAKIRRNLPNFLYDFLVCDLGLFSKGKDCLSVGGRHLWYNEDGVNSACYYCEVVEHGQLWKRQKC